LERPSADHVLYVLRAADKLKSLPPLLEGLQGKRLGLDVGRISFVLERDVMEHGLKAEAVNVARGAVRIADLPAGSRRSS
jgi:hypothetical protein